MEKSTSNVSKLRAITNAFQISIQHIAKVTGVSRPLVSRVLSARDPYLGPPSFWLAVERNLPEIIAGRQGQVFDVPAMASEAVQGLDVIRRQAS